MSYFDLDPAGAESARQNARLNPITPGDMGPGFWTGTAAPTLKGFGQLIAQPALLLGDAVTPAMMPYAKKIDDLFGGSNAQDYLKSEQQKTVKAVHDLMPGPQTSGFGRVAYGLTSVVPQAVVGGIVGGPAGAAATVGVMQGYAAKRVGETYEGLDETTALMKGAIEGGFAAAGVAMPAAFGTSLLTRLGTGAAANVGLGGVQRGSTSAVLEARGYGELAEQYKVFDKEAMLIDLVLGTAFGGLHHVMAPGEAIHVPPSVADEALSANKQQHLEISTAPGVPADPQSRGLHSRAIDQAMRDIMADEPVDLSRTGIENAAFVENRQVQEAQVKAALAEQGPLRSALDAIDELRARAEELGITPADEVLFEGHKLVDEAVDTVAVPDEPAKPLSKLEAGRQRLAKQEAAVRAAEERIALRKLAAEAHGPRDLSGAVHGRDGEVFVGDRREPVRFVLVEADALAATTTKADNQFRDRTRAASQQQIARIANDLQFGRLGEAPTMAEGAPTVAQSGQIVGGNGRVAAVQQAYASGKGEGYRVALEQRAAEFGLTADQVTGMTRPMLVRQFTNPVDVRTAAILSNEGSGLKMSALEQAKVDAERMPSMPEMPESGDLGAASLRNFVTQWLSRYPQGELGEFVTAEGKLSPQGEKRLQAAMLFKAYGDSPTLSRLIESTDDLSKNLTGALVKAAANVAEARDLIADGSLHDLDIQPQLLQAVDMTHQLRADGVKLNDWLDQHDMFGTGVGPESILLMEHFQKSVRSQKAVTGALTGYYDAVRALGDPRQANMFDAPPPSRGEILRAVLGREETAVEPTSKAIEFKPAQVEDSFRKKKPGLSAEFKTGETKTGEPIMGGMDLAIEDGRLFPAWVDNGLPFGGKGSKGAVTNAYEAAIAEAQRRGLRFTSDSSVTTDATRVYDALEKRGYEVTKNPGAYLVKPPEVITERWVTDDKSPVYTVVPRGAAALVDGKYGGTIEAAKTLSASDRAVEQRFAQWVLEDVDRAVAEYAKLPDSNGGKVLNTDVARDLSRDYAASKDAKSALSAAVHEPASWLIKEIYRRKLAEKAGPGERNKVTFTAGGTGAGKSSGIKAVPEAKEIVDTSQIVYDTNMNTEASAVNRVEQALAAGKDVSLIYVARDPVAALTQGALPRAMGMGRTVRLAEHAKTHIGSAEVVEKLARKYKDDPRVDVQIVDNTGPKGSQRLADIAIVEELDYTNLEARLRTALDAEHKNGRISDAVYQGTLGRDDGKGQPGGARSAAKAAEGGPPKAPDGGEPQDTFAPDGRGNGPKPTQPAGEGLSTTTVDQVLHDAPNAQTLDADGELRNAQMALADADQNITRAEKDAPGFEAAAACALR